MYYFGCRHCPQRFRFSTKSAARRAYRRHLEEDCPSRKPPELGSQPPGAFLRRVIAQREKEQEAAIVAQGPVRRRCSTCRDWIREQPGDLPGELCSACARAERRRVAARRARGLDS